MGWRQALTKGKPQAITWAPAVLSFLAFVFMAVAMLGGLKPNFGEGLSVINFNTSRLGQNLLKEIDITDKAAEGCGQAGDVTNDIVDGAGEVAGKLIDIFGGDGGSVRDKADKAGDKAGGAASEACNKGAEHVQGAINLSIDMVNKALGSVAKAVGIQEYYSLHIGALCHGKYEPGWDDPEASRKVTKCTKKFAMAELDLRAALDAGIQDGPIKDATFAGLKLVDGLVEQLEKIPKAVEWLSRLLASIVVFLFLGSAFALGAGLCERKKQSRTCRMAQVGCLVGVAVFLGVGTLMALGCALGITISAEVVKKAVNKHAAEYGIVAATSPGLYAMLWGAVVFAAAAVGIFGFVSWRAWRDNRSKAKHDPGYSSTDGRGYMHNPDPAHGTMHDITGELKEER